MKTTSQWVENELRLLQKIDRLDQEIERLHKVNASLNEAVMTAVYQVHDLEGEIGRLHYDLKTEKIIMESVRKEFFHRGLINRPDAPIPFTYEQVA